MANEYRTAVLADSPVTYWRLDEPSGTVSNDYINVLNVADYVNTPTLGAASLIANDSDTAVTFSRASLEYTVTGGTMPAGASAGVSIEGWVKFATVTAATNYPIVRWNGTSPTTDTSLRYYVDLNAWRYFYQDATTLRNVIGDAWTPTVGTIYHIVVTHDYAAKLVRFYANGTQIGATKDVSANGAAVVQPANKFASVARHGSDYFDGTLDEVAIYNSVLSGTRVLAHYNANFALFTPTTASLTTTRFAPTISLPELVTPSTAALSTTKFAPTVAISDNQRVTPSTVALSATTFAPTVTATANQVVTPTTASITTATLAPSVTVTNNALVVPEPAALVLARFAPTVILSDHKLVTPVSAHLVLTEYPPTVEVHSLTPLPRIVSGTVVIARGPGATVTPLPRGSTTVVAIRRPSARVRR